MIGDTPAPTLLRIDPRHQKAEDVARTFCEENHLPVATVAPLVSKQVCKLIEAVQHTVGREESMRRNRYTP